MNLDKIKELCKEKGITINKLEQLSGISQKSIGKWEKNEPSIDKVQKLADYFNVSTDYLLGRTDNPSPVGELSAAQVSGGKDYSDLPEEALEKLKDYEKLLREAYKK